MQELTNDPIPQGAIGSMSLVLDGPRDGEENMALDRAALHRAERGEASLRIYSWDRPAVTLGRSQRPEEVTSIFPGLPTVPRPSGGGAVLHGFDVTVALAIPLPMIGVAPRALRETYVALVGPLAEALSACGLPCESRDQERSGGTVNCFASAGKMDLVHSETGKKVAGCALAATRDAALLHVSIPSKRLPASLPIDDDTAESFTNPPWNASHFPHALAAAWRCENLPVDLSSLDPRLDVWTRASAVLHQILDPRRINDQIDSAFLNEYDRDATIFSSGDAGKILSRRDELSLGLANSLEEVRGALTLIEGFLSHPETMVESADYRRRADYR